MTSTKIRTGDDALNFRKNSLDYVNDFKHTHDELALGNTRLASHENALGLETGWKIVFLILQNKTNQTHRH